MKQHRTVLSILCVVSLHYRYSCVGCLLDGGKTQLVIFLGFDASSSSSALTLWVFCHLSQNVSSGQIEEVDCGRTGCMAVKADDCIFVRYVLHNRHSNNDVGGSLDDDDADDADGCGDVRCQITMTW